MIIAVRLSLLCAAAIAAPFAATMLFESLPLAVAGSKLSEPGEIPGVTKLLILGLCTIVAVAARPSFVRSYFFGNWLQVARVTLFWSVTATALWLAIMFFLDSLAEIGRTFVLSHLVVLSLFLVLLAVAWLPKWHVIAWICALAVVVLWAGPAAIPAPSATLTEAVFGTLMTMPALTVTAFIAATFMGWAALMHRLPDGTELLARSVSLVAWVFAIHFLWLLTLFAFGAANLPRWLPLTTAILMALVGVGIPFALGARQGSLMQLAYAGSRRQDGSSADLFVRTQPARQSPKGRAWIISYTGVSNEPRVLRQCEALIASGWEVVVCGHDGHSRRPPEWHFVRLPTRDPFDGIGQVLLRTTRALANLLLVYGRPARCFAWAAHIVNATTPLWIHTRQELVSLARAHPELKADLVISHDHHTANAGFAVAQIYDAKFSIDVHEHAASQYFNDPNWVKWDRPVTVEIQRHYLAKADIVTVVCQGIADELAKENSLRRAPVIIRNLPFKNVQEFRPVGSRTKILYHGDLSPRREIHALVESMQWWREDIDLVLRGAGDPTYVGDLNRQVARHNLYGRVQFEPPVPFDQIVPAANNADIGFFSFTGNSPQIRFTLPNKFFEYIMAGLCLCVSDTEEVGRIVRAYNCGILIATHSPQAIADAINGLTVDEIERYKLASIAGANELNWEVERGYLLRAYESILPLNAGTEGAAWQPIPQLSK